MSLSEFDLIDRFFAQSEVHRDDVILGVGDDAALLRVTPGHEFASATCSLAEGFDFGVDADPRALGHRALAISLARLAATGAEPAWATLALTLPSAQVAWLHEFSRGLLGLAKQHSVQLVGGDTTRGPRQITLIASGYVPEQQAIRGDGAQPDDLIFVTGTLGDAGLALLVLQDEIRDLRIAERRALITRLQEPQPPVAAGRALRGLASAAVAVCDGLSAGVRELLAGRRLGATIYAEQLPISPLLASTLTAAGGWPLPLTASGDCELCFTASSGQQAAVERACAELGSSCTWIGIVERTPGMRCILADGTDLAPAAPF